MLEFLDRFTGDCIRRIPSGGAPEVFLTFDDGPHPESTPALLALLKRENVTATFFLVAQKAERHRELAVAIARAGHTFGNHSLDHTYGHYFRKETRVRDWIARGQASLTATLGKAPIAFRSPAGVRTPELGRALLDLRLPHVHWAHRCYDTVFRFRGPRAARMATKAEPGDIILLHDVPRRGSVEFLGSVETLVRGLRARGFAMRALEPEDFCDIP